MSFHPESSKPDKSEQPSWLPDGYHPDQEILDYFPILRSPKMLNCLPFVSEENQIVRALKTARLSRVFIAISKDLEAKNSKMRRGRLTRESVKTHVLHIFDLVVNIKEETQVAFPATVLSELRSTLFVCLEFIASKATLGRTKTQLKAEITKYSLHGFLTREMRSDLLAILNK